MSKLLLSNALRTYIPGKTLVLALGLAGLAYQASAVPVTVQEVGIGANEVVEMTTSTGNTVGTHWVYAGSVSLLVNGAATTGFCIDPFHWSITGSQSYDAEALSVGPKPPGGPMGDATALKIEQLWAKYYSSDITGQNAAGLQIAIWELVGGANFQLNSSPDYGAGDMLNWVNNNSSATAADLIGLTGPGQDYVIPNFSSQSRTSVPDGGQTALLLGFGLLGLVAARSRFPKLAHGRQS
jgi:hypothetical protein